MLREGNWVCVTKGMRSAYVLALGCLLTLPLAFGQHPSECIPPRCITRVHFTKPCHPSPNSASAICDGVILEFGCIAPRSSGKCEGSGIKREALSYPSMDMSTFQTIPYSASTFQTGPNVGER